MTPRILLVAACVAALAGPASAASARPGTWSGYGSATLGNASISGSVAWADGSSSSCSGYVNGVGAGLSCSGDVAFSAACAGVSAEAVVTWTCVDTARRLHVQAEAVVLPIGRFAGTLSYERV